MFSRPFRRFLLYFTFARFEGCQTELSILAIFASHSGPVWLDLMAILHIIWRFSFIKTEGTLFTQHETLQLQQKKTLLLLRWILKSFLNFWVSFEGIWSPNESKIGNFENESILTRNRPETTAISWRECSKYWSWLRQIIVYQHLPRPAMVTNKIPMTMTDLKGKSLISKSPIFCLQGMKNPRIQQIASLFLTTFWCNVKCCKKV